MIVVIQNGISCSDCSLLRMESRVVIVVIQNGISCIDCSDSEWNLL